MSESVDVESALATAAAPLLKAGFRVESQVPGMLVLVGGKVPVPTILMIILTVVTVGFWIPVWIVLYCLPRVPRTTLTVENGVVAKARTWRTS